jgi:hypothetical protein
MFEYPLDITYQILCSPLCTVYLNAVFESQLNVDLYDIWKSDGVHCES